MKINAAKILEGQRRATMSYSRYANISKFQTDYKIEQYYLQRNAPNRGHT